MTALGQLDAEAAATLIAAAADVALVLDGQGVILDLSLHSSELADALPQHADWIGRPWAEVVTADSRAKVESLLRGTETTAAQRWRHLNHPSADGTDVAVLYSAVPLDTAPSRDSWGGGNRIVVFGRDLRAVSRLQQRLIDAQQSLERDYARIRDVETRYRLLFHMASDAVLILDGSGRRVTDSNQAARSLFGAGRALRVNRLFDAASAPSIQALLDTVRSSGRADDVRARLAEGGRDVLVSASLFREEIRAPFPAAHCADRCGSGRRRGAECEIQADQADGECTRRLRRHRHGWPDRHRQRGLPGDGTGADRGSRPW